MIVFVWTERKICVYYRLHLQSSSRGRGLKLANEGPSTARSNRGKLPSKYHCTYAIECFAFKEKLYVSNMKGQIIALGSSAQ